MLEVRITLLPQGNPDEGQLHGLIRIYNDGTGTEQRGNYKAEFTHTKRYAGQRPEPYMTAEVKGFNRSKSVYDLLREVLKNAKYVKHPAAPQTPELE